jgi:hypothetical protein
MIRRALPLACTLSLFGCSGSGGSSTTRALLEVRYDEAPPAPSRIHVTVFDRFGQIGTTQIDPAPLPGKLRLDGLPDVAQPLRVMVLGEGGAAPVMGTARFDTLPHAQVTVLVTLSAVFSDGDGDGVPDEIDDCIAAADPSQTSTSGDGSGDACQGDAAVAMDLGSADLATVELAADLAQADLADAAAPDDLYQAPDLMPPASKCPVSGALLCDGFDNAAINGIWTKVQTNGTVTTDTTHIYRGTRSLHLHNNAFAAAGDADVELVETATLSTTHFWARAFVYVEATFTTAGDIMTVEQNVNPYSGVVLALENGSFATHDLIDNTDKFAQAPTTMPANQWVCLEWEVQLGTIAAPTGFTQLFVNGGATPVISGNENLGPNPAISQFSLGLITSATGVLPARDVWIDEVVINSQATGCQN